MKRTGIAGIFAACLELTKERVTVISQDKKFGCVTNAGVDGHSTWGHIFAFEHWFPLIPDLKPKFVSRYVDYQQEAFRHIFGHLRML